jgi:hypothetical protein
MLRLAAERTQAHTYSPRWHTPRGREVPGAESLLVPATSRPCSNDDPAEGVAIARHSLQAIPRLPAYRQNLLRSSATRRRRACRRLVDALVVVGDEAAVAARG